MGTTPSAAKDELIICGYLRHHTNINNISVPQELWRIVFTYFHLKYELLKFSTKYQKDNELEFLDNNKCIKKVDHGNDTKYYSWVHGDKPVYSGIYLYIFVYILYFIN